MTQQSDADETREDEQVGDELTPLQQARALYDSMSMTEKAKTAGVFLLSAVGAFTVVRWGSAAVRRARR